MPNVNINGVDVSDGVQLSGVSLQNSSNVIGVDLTGFGGGGGGSYVVRLYGMVPGNGGFMDDASACSTNKNGIPVDPGRLYIDNGFSGIWLDAEVSMPFENLQPGRFYYVESDSEINGYSFQYAGEGMIGKFTPC